MGDEDFIKRGAAYAAVMNNLSNSAALDAIAALPAASAEDNREEVMPNDETSKERRPATSPGVTAGATPADDVRAEALKEAANAIWNGPIREYARAAQGPELQAAHKCRDAILALIPGAKP